MNIFSRSLKHVRGFAKRFAPRSLKAWVIDYENRVHGEFLHDVDVGYRSRISDWIERYSENGQILDLGCSDGHVAFSLDPAKYESYTGVDLSEIAIHRAIDLHRGTDREAKNRFIIGDIFEYQPEGAISVVLFKDSIYYASLSRILDCCMRLRSSLSDEGVFIVHMDNIKRHHKIKELIYKYFVILEENSDLDSSGVLLVFR